MSVLHVCGLNVSSPSGPVTELAVLHWVNDWEPLLDLILTPEHIDSFLQLGGLPSKVHQVLKWLATTKRRGYDFPYLFTFDVSCTSDHIKDYINYQPPDERRLILLKAGRADLLPFLSAYK